LPILNIWLAIRDENKVEILISLYIRSDPIWKTLEVIEAETIAAAMEEDMEEWKGTVDLVVQDPSSHHLYE
jgi:hypothetical protein